MFNKRNINYINDNVQLVVIIGPHLKRDLVSKFIATMCLNLVLVIGIISIRNVNISCGWNQWWLVIQPCLISIHTSDYVVEHNTRGMDPHLGLNRIMVSHFQKRETLLQDTYDPFNVVSKECMPMVEQLFLVSISRVITPTPSKFS